MKKAFLLLLLIIVSGSFMMLKNNEETDNTELSFYKKVDKDINKIAVVSDIHYGMEGLNETVLDAIFDDISKKDIDLLILTGDNVNSGKINEHELLIEKLDKYHKDLEIITAVGNHDIFSLKNVEYIELYKEYGYDSYFLKDDSSLSYSVMFNNMLVVILDTGGHGFSNHPSVSEETVKWLDKNFKHAKDLNKEILVAGHYPVLANYDNFENIELLKEKIGEYNIPLYIAGHLHGQNIRKEGNLSEIACKQAVSYKPSYILISFDGDYIKAETYYPDIEEYVRNNDIDDEYLLNYNLNSLNDFKKQNDFLVEEMAVGKDIDSAVLELAKEVFFEIMYHRTAGDLFEYATDIRNQNGMEILRDIAEGTNYYPWIDEVLNNADEYLKGFMILR